MAFLNISVSGLLAFQRSLATVSHNISNVNTDGYSRQRSELATRNPVPYGNGFLGMGVSVVSTQRVYDQFATEQVRTHTSTHSELKVYHDLARQMDNLLGDPDAGLSPALHSFFNAVHGVADNPASIPSRQVMLTEADLLVERFRAIDQRMTDLQAANDRRMQNTVDEINSLAEGIAKINHDIVIATAAASGHPPNDLLDRRDEMLRLLAEKIPVKTLEQDNGAVNVFIGKGQSLVMGNRASRLGIVPNPHDISRMEVELGGANISSLINGGELGAILQFREQMLEPSRNALGQIALGIAGVFNEQHRLGLDLRGELGGDFFNVQGLPGTPNHGAPAITNTGTAEISFEIVNVSAVTTSDYRLEFQDGEYQLRRLSDNHLFPPVAAAVAVSDGISADGLHITVTGGVQEGDSFALRPTRSAGREMTVAITDPTRIAAAGVLRSELHAANLGDGRVGNPDVVAAETLDLAAVIAAGEITLVYQGTEFQLFLAGDPAPVASFVYDAATDSPKTVDLAAVLGDEDYQGISFVVTGAPLEGDRFTIMWNSGATGDNRNALELAHIQTAEILENGNNVQTAYGQMIASIGTRTHQLSIRAGVQESVLQQAVERRESISGVNLDEEAANLIRLQQAYQASAQMISVAQTVFDTLINAVRR